MSSLPCFNRYFTLNWRLLVVALIALVFLCKLGFWQLARAKEKTHLLEKYAQFARQSPSPWRPEMALPSQYQRVSLKGNYLPTLLFLDNQHYQHQFGYHVITPFAVNADKIVLIDRGWVAGDISRQKLPSVNISPKRMNVMGSVYYPPKNHWLLGQSYEKKGEKGYLIEQLDPLMISHVLHKSVYPFIIRLDKTEAYGYRRDWLIVAMPPERHYAYAVQWFLLALVVLVFFIVLNVKRIDEIK